MVLPKPRTIHRMTELEVDSSTLAILAIVFTLLGALISSVFGYFALKRQDERKFKHELTVKQEADEKRRVATYRRLWSLAEMILPRSTIGLPVRYVRPVEYQTIDSVIAQNLDVLDDSTVAAWDTKKVADLSHADIITAYINVQCEAFWKDLKDHYDRYKLNTIPPSTK